MMLYCAVSSEKAVMGMDRTRRRPLKVENGKKDTRPLPVRLLTGLAMTGIRSVDCRFIFDVATLTNMKAAAVPRSTMSPNAIRLSLALLPSHCATRIGMDPSVRIPDSLV
jgi:hypothetical protein